MGRKHIFYVVVVSIIAFFLLILAGRRLFGAGGDGPDHTPGSLAVTDNAIVPNKGFLSYDATGSYIQDALVTLRSGAMDTSC